MCPAACSYSELLACGIMVRILCCLCAVKCCLISGNILFYAFYTRILYLYRVSEDFLFLTLQRSISYIIMYIMEQMACTILLQAKQVSQVLHLVLLNIEA
jgi:hypothetical protein